MKFSRQNLLIFFLSLLLSLAAAELLLRAVTPSDTNQHQLFCEYDPILGWRKIPNLTAWHEHPEYRTLEKTNSQGLRGPEYPLAKPPGQHRILVLGDSFAEGYTVEFESLFSEILEDSLAARCAAEVEVINGGTGGYATDQELLFFEKQGVQYQPDVTVLLFCINDPWYNAQPRYWRGAKPQFVLAGDSLRLTNVPVPTIAAQGFFEKTRTWTLENLQLARYLKRAKDKLAFAGRLALPVEWEIYRQAETPAMTEAWQVTEALLARLRQKTAAAGSDLLVFYIPEKIEVYPAQWQNFLETYSAGPAVFAPDKPRQRLAAICERLGVRLLEPTADFIAASAEPLYFQTDWHWNAAGHRLAGQLLAGALACPDTLATE